jgi:hypothetical protein
MNRAWIPAGALAGVSVAGLIALGPLTHFDTPVSFPGSLTIDSSAPTKASSKPVALKINEGTVGVNIKPAVSVSQRGGQAAAATTNPDVGEVGFHKTPSSTHTVTAVVPKSTPKPKPKKATKRATSIGADSGPNGDNGLAGVGSGSSTSVGAQSGTPGSDAP